jgi:hypothetical protein
MKAKLVDLANVVRSKNSGPFELTLDIIFKSRAIYEAIRNAGAISEDIIMSLYQLDRSEMGKIIAFDPANAIKITFRRKIPSGGFGDTDIYGAQQHAPLLGIEFDIETEALNG